MTGIEPEFHVRMCSGTFGPARELLNQVYRSAHEASVAAGRNGLGKNDFDVAFGKRSRDVHGAGLART